MAKTKYMVTSGFLGAGKTTSMLAFARSINARWGKAAILANDLGASNIVDADFTATSDVLTTSIAGNCICYQHENLQLAEREGEEFELMPFTCIVDPERLRMLMEGEGDLNLPAEMRFLLDAQMAEADLIVLNKVDLLSSAEVEKRLALIRTLHPDTPVMTMSARTGEGVDAVVDYLMTHEAAAEHREIGYGSEAFMAAERLLSWYNRRVFLEQREDRNLDFNAVLGDIFEEIRSGLKAKGGNVPHLKMFASGVGEDFFKASLIGVDYPVEYDHKLAAEYSALSVIINARAAAESEAVAAAVDDSLDAIAQKYALRERTFFLENFGMMEEGRGNGGRASRY